MFIEGTMDSIIIIIIIIIIINHIIHATFIFYCKLQRSECLCPLQIIHKLVAILPGKTCKWHDRFSWIQQPCNFLSTIFHICFNNVKMCKQSTIWLAWSPFNHVCCIFWPPKRFNITKTKVKLLISFTQRGEGVKYGCFKWVWKWNLVIGNNVWNLHGSARSYHNKNKVINIIHTMRRRGEIWLLQMGLGTKLSKR